MFVVLLAESIFSGRQVLGFSATLFLVSGLVAWFFDLVNVYAFAWSFSLLFVAGFCLVFLQVLSSQRADSQVRKTSFEYCWRRVNEILRGMDNADTLEWGGGRDRKSILRSFSEGAKSKQYRALYGRLVRAKSEVVVIYCVDDDDIASFVSNPGPSRIVDPFFDFSPRESSRPSPEFHGGGVGRGRGRGRLSDDSDPFFPANRPDDEFVDRAFQGGR